MTAGFAGRHVPQLRLPEGVRLETLESTLAAPSPSPGFERSILVENERLAPEHYRMRLRAPLMSAGRPGQFAMVRSAPEVDMHPLLPRPMAIYGYLPATGEIDLVYRVIGEGTLAMSERRAGEEVEIVGPVGRPFAIHPNTTGVLVVGRGIGTCSLAALTEDASRRDLSIFGLLSGRLPDVVLGTDLLGACAQEYQAVNDHDGTSSIEQVRPFVERVLSSGGVQQAFVCGANRLIDLVCEAARPRGVEVQISLEAHMACGLGYCHGCATGAFGEREESPLVCRDGPVFRASKIAL